ncbi:MAG: hypothetical protein ABJF11_10615 [Reichenbachiella sp.]|uniref:hypothetical protein n=1 Tax=Reichenbachiella sp. TaxID=2184521 RepID=UPI003265CA24
MKKCLIHLVVLILFQSCTPEGTMRTWSSNEDYDRRFKNVLAMGLVNNVTVRSDVENELVYAAQKINLKAANGMSLFPPELGKPFEDIERVKARLREKGYDGILTAALIDIRAERYVPPETSYEPLIYYDRFRNYYYRTYDLVYRPGYYSASSKYFIETNFYELKEGKLVWSGRSEVFEYGELESFIPTYSRRLFKELMKEGVIATQ